MRRSSRPVRRLAALVVAGALLPSVAGLPGASGAAASGAHNPMVFGLAAASRAEVETHERALGRAVGGVHYYRQWDSTLFGRDHLWMRDTGHTLFLAIRSQRRDGRTVLWRDIAAARPGSTLHAEMLAQATQIKAFRAPVYVTFNHEPDAKLAAGMGTPAEYVAAWRAVVSTWRSVGATNARPAFNTTAYGYARKDGKNARYYYPGDAFVDAIASDAYNWYGCRAGESWRALGTVLAAHRAFGAMHPTKKLVVMEFASGEDAAVPGRKGQWLREAGLLFQQPGWEQFDAFLYWPGRNFPGDTTGCMDYTTSASAVEGLRAAAAAGS